jgi:CheY-like chemotaxis protein
VLRFAISLAQNEIRHRARLVLDLRETATVAANTHRLGQVFLNLLLNAAQSIEEGHFAENQISVASRRAEDGRALVEVTDTGCGIPAENLPHLFESYFTTKPAGVGTGLGLSISREIVDSIGGEIQVESRPGKGSTFRVLLPPAAPAVEAPAVEQRRPLAPLRGRVLLIDDEPIVAKATARVLEKAHDVVTLHGGLEALGRLESDPHFDVILCDLMMPDLTGMDLHARLASRSPGLAERMIFMTGGAFTPRAQQFLKELQAGAPGRDLDREVVLEKPCDPQRLLSVVNGALARAECLDELPSRRPTRSGSARRQ